MSPIQYMIRDHLYDEDCKEFYENLLNLKMIVSCEDVFLLDVNLQSPLYVLLDQLDEKKNDQTD